MRVGFLTYGLDRAPTGIGRYAVELLRSLAALPDAPELVLLTTERSDPHGLWGAFERHALPGCRLLPALMTAGNALLSAAARRYRLDLIHDPNGIAPFLGPALGARRIVTIHDAFAYVYPQTHNRLDNWRYRWMLPHAARAADAVLTDSHHSQADLVRFLHLKPDHVHAIHCAIGQRFAPVPPTREREATLARYGVAAPYLLYVGGLNARKNIGRMLRAFAAAREQAPELQLVIAGKRQWQSGEIDAAMTELDLEPHVRFTGYFDDADLPTLYSAAEAFVFPSLYEGFGLPPLEAMACGTPVITSSASSLPEVVGDAALVGDPYDLAWLADAMVRAYRDSGLRRMLRSRGLERAKLFSWEKTAQATFRIYQAALAPNDAAAPVVL
ncbi:glycosyltransferase family 4 protein [Chloroflexia bacterium SDU3-3]|nr:glycosyltransferase family 4 protein [Chloroflexia bacterium SDU3-3]